MFPFPIQTRLQKSLKTPKFDAKTVPFPHPWINYISMCLRGSGFAYSHLLIPLFIPQLSLHSFQFSHPFPISFYISRSIAILSMGRRGLLDLETHFAFYGAYHSNPTNIFIHILFVWPIFFTALMLFYYTPSFYAFPKCPCGFNTGLVLNLGFLFALFYGVFYALLDKRAGSFAALMCFLCWVGASVFAFKLGYALTWKVVLAAQLFCWTGQFIGHGMFEKRAPALIDNLTQAFLMAPFFVLLEILQTSFKYEPYKGFHGSVKAKIEAQKKAWQDKKEKKSS